MAKNHIRMLQDLLSRLHKFSQQVKLNWTETHSTYHSVVELLLPEIREILQCEIAIFGKVIPNNDGGGQLIIELKNSSSIEINNKNSITVGDHIEIGNRIFSTISKCECAYYYGKAFELNCEYESQLFDSLIIGGLNLEGAVFGILIGNLKGRETRGNPFTNYEKSLLEIVCRFLNMGLGHGLVINYEAAGLQTSRSVLFKAAQDLLQGCLRCSVEQSSLDKVVATYIDMRVSLLNSPSGGIFWPTRLYISEKVDFLMSSIQLEETNVLRLRIDEEPYQRDDNAPWIEVPLDSCLATRNALRRVMKWIQWACANVGTNKQNALKWIENSEKILSRHTT